MVNEFFTVYHHVIHVTDIFDLSSLILGFLYDNVPDLTKPYFLNLRLY